MQTFVIAIIDPDHVDGIERTQFFLRLGNRCSRLRRAGTTNGEILGAIVKARLRPARSRHCAAAESSQRFLERLVDQRRGDTNNTEVANLDGEAAEANSLGFIPFRHAHIHAL
jgi:hypothetical protein